MVAVIPMQDKKLTDVKIGELPKWIPMRDFTPKGIAEAFQSCYYRNYNKYVNMKKGSVVGVSMVLAAYVLFNYCRSYKELKHERRCKYHCRVLSVEGTLCIPDHGLCPAPLNPFVS